MSVLYLTEADVAQHLTIRVAMDLLEEAFRRMAAGQASNVPRARVQATGFVLHSMSAAAAYQGIAGWKCYSTTRHGAHFLVGLYDQESGALVALVEADQLGRLRTGAATGVATEWMASAEAVEMGLFGAGRQAETQLAAVAAARPLKRAFVYSRDEERRQEFADRMSARLQLEVIPTDRPQEACEELPIVVTATSSKSPVFDGNWLDEGTFVAAVGSNWLNKAEIDATVIRRADSIVCDDVAACRHEAGDFVDAIERGIFDWSRAVDLADVVAGRAVGRGSAESLTLFKSVGLAIEDVVLAGRLYQLAREQGFGTPLPF